MDKYTWIDITICIDMEIAASTCNTSSHKLCIILEIHGKQRLCCTVFTDALIGFSSLFRCGEQLRCSIISNRHIMEIPDKVRSKIDQTVVKRLRCDGLEICACITCRDTKYKLLLSEKIDGFDNLLVYTISSSAICCSLKSFQ